MTRTPYDYSTRKNVLPISWEDFHGLCRALALAVAPYAPEIILPLARGGTYPGAPLAHIMRVEVYSIRLSRRVNDEVVRAAPLWLQEPPAAVAGRLVLIVDEISSTGETLRLARTSVVLRGAAGIRTAVLYAHSWGLPEPGYVGLVSDALIVNPWDREVLVDAAFAVNPEYAAAFAEQGLAPDASFLIAAGSFKVAKAYSD
jgi:uncharacterized protein